MNKKNINIARDKPVDKFNLSGRLNALGWHKVDVTSLDIVIRHNELGIDKIFGYVWELEEFISDLEKGELCESE